MNDIVQNIKKRLLISSIVRQAIELKGSGSHFLGLCPFHKEKTPSFHVRDHVGSFKCFGCGASGDVFAFIMRLRGIGFKEALSELSEKAGLSDVPKVRAEKPIKNDEALLRAQAVASRFFIEQLHGDAGRSVMNYLLKDRRLKESMIKQAGIGFGGSSNRDFLNYLAHNNVREQTAIDAGLIKPGNFSKVAQFLGRITIPIKRSDGTIVAFGGRAFENDDPNQPKYVNTHAYLHYEKKKSFYGLFESKAAILQGQIPFLVEGYFDAMALWAAGVPALALCGTALSDDHIQLLKRMSSRVVMCFDDDDAGYKALRSSLVKLWRSNILSNAVVLDKKDPGDYLASGQLAQLKKCIGQPVDATCLVIDRVALNIDSDISTRISEIDELLPIFATIARPLMRRQYVAYLAQKLHEDPGILWSEISQKAKKLRPKDVVAASPVPSVLSLGAEEKWLLQILRCAPHLAEQVSPLLWEKIRPDLKPLFLHINEHPEQIKQLLSGEYEDLRFSVEEAREMLEALHERLSKSLRRDALKIKRQELQRAEKEKDFASVFKTLREHSSILAKNKTPKAKPSEAKENPEPRKVNEMAKIDTISLDIDCGNDWL